MLDSLYKIEENHTFKPSYQAFYEISYLLK